MGWRRVAAFSQAQRQTVAGAVLLHVEPRQEDLPSPISISRTRRQNQYFDSPTTTTRRAHRGCREPIEGWKWPSKTIDIGCRIQPRLRGSGWCSLHDTRLKALEERPFSDAEPLTHARIAGTLRGNEKPGMSSGQVFKHVVPLDGRYPNTPAPQERRWVVIMMLTPWSEFKQRPAR